MTSVFARTRRAVDTMMVALLWLHVALIAAVAYSLGTDWAALTGVATLIACAATVMRVSAHGALATRLTIAVAFIAMISTLLAAFAGSPWQVDMHMYYFAALAIVAAYCDRNVILTAAATAAIYHLVLNFALPALVFPGGGSIGRVLVHAVILVLETGALVWMIEQVNSAVRTSAAALAQSETYRVQLEEKAAAELVMRAKLDEVRHQALESAANDVETGLGEATSGLLAAARGLTEVSHTLTGNAEMANGSANVALNAAAETSANVQSVASATEELSASIREISAQVSAGAQRAATANNDAVATARIVNTLSEEVLRIGDVVSLINNVASRTNLLALNATIEAARAGDAGKGFAVVASEVKSLAAQTADATTRIQSQIAALQAGTAAAVKAIGSVGATIDAMTSTTTAIAAAVEEQHLATDEIARSLQNAAEGVERIKQAVAGVADATQVTQRAADSVINEGEQVNTLSRAVSVTARALVDKLRAA